MKRMTLKGNKYKKEKETKIKFSRTTFAPNKIVPHQMNVVNQVDSPGKYPM